MVTILHLALYAVEPVGCAAQEVAAEGSPECCERRARAKQVARGGRRNKGVGAGFWGKGSISEVSMSEASGRVGLLKCAFKPTIARFSSLIARLSRR